MKKRDKLLSLHKRNLEVLRREGAFVSKSEFDNFPELVQSWCDYKAARNNVQAVIANAKRDHFSSVIDANIGQSKLLWANLSKLDIHTSKKRNNCDNIPQFRPNVLNSYFLNCIGNNATPG